MDDYVTVRIPESLKLLYEKNQEELDLGYRSFAEFVKEAVRKRLEEIKDVYGTE